jgi:hypothetical protein
MKKTPLFITALVLSVATSQAHAQLGASVDAKADLRLDLAPEAQIEAQTGVEARTEAQQNKPATTKADTVKSDTAVDAKTDRRGATVSAEHQSAVAKAIQAILAASATNVKIGEQIRVIAQQQNDTQAAVSDNVARIETESKVKTFLIGSDYKTIGALRSDLAKSKASIEQLKRTIEQTTDATLKATLLAEVKTLEIEQASIETFVEAKASSFSLFGWAVKLFSK